MSTLLIHQLKIASSPAINKIWLDRYQTSPTMTSGDGSRRRSESKRSEFGHHIVRTCQIWIIRQNPPPTMDKYNNQRNDHRLQNSTDPFSRLLQQRISHSHLRGRSQNTERKRKAATYSAAHSSQSGQIRLRNRRKTTFRKRCLRMIKQQKTRFYILGRCVSMLLCWHDHDIPD